MKKGYPLILVFYLDSEMMRTPSIIKPFVESVNNLLAYKESNALAFFIPTKDNERLECINPIIIKEPDMEKINQLVEDIRTNFAMNIDIDVPDEEIMINPEICKCGGNCKCIK
jgi:hypothetical protein